MADQSRLEIVIDSRGAEANVSSVRSELGRMERAGETASRAADDVGQSFEDVARSAGMYRDASGRLREANGRFASSARQAEIRARSLGGELNKASGGFRSIARSSQLAVPPVGQLTTLFAGLSGVIGARQIINYSDAWQNAGNQLRQVTDSAEELAGTQERLMEVANTTRADFGSTASLYSRLARSTTELGLTQSDLIGLTRTINQSFAVSGATAEEASAAITQLSQGLAAGALRGDEFNSVSEQAPGIMRAIAESLDMTIGELRDFAAEGGITAEIVVNALQDSADAIENDFGRAVATFGQQMTVARNNLIQFVGASDTVEQGVANIGESIVELSENLDAVGQAATVVAGVFAGRMAGRFVTVAAGMTTAAGAATALRTALAFLGGPVGILVGAGGLLYAFREELGLIDPAARAADEALAGLNATLNSGSEMALAGSYEALTLELQNVSLEAQNAMAQLLELEMRERFYAETHEGVAESVRGAIEDQQDLLAGLWERQVELQGAIKEVQEQREALKVNSEAQNENTAALKATHDEQGNYIGVLKDSEDAVSDYGATHGTASRAVGDFAGAAESAAVRLAEIGRESDPRYTFGAGGDTTGDRARARFEASANRPGDAQVQWYGANDSAMRTNSTAAYDAAGSAIPNSPSGADAPASGSGQHLGTLTLAGKDGGKIDVQANAEALSKFVSDLMADAASAI